MKQNKSIFSSSEEKIRAEHIEHRFEECVDMIVAFANTIGVPIKSAHTRVFLKAATKTFLFQTRWYNVEWSCRCINDMYWRFSILPKKDIRRISVYYNFEEDEISTEIF